MSEPRRVYFINELVRDPKDNGFIPCIAVEGEDGYHRTDWNWGKDRELAERIAKEKNEALGYTEKEAFEIVMGTISLSMQKRKKKK